MGERKRGGRQETGERGRGRWDNEEVEGRRMDKGRGDKIRFGKGEMEVKTRNRRQEIQTGLER
jgi:hypothetical protein